jgi:hypothetical protein
MALPCPWPPPRAASFRPVSFGRLISRTVLCFPFLAPLLQLPAPPSSFFSLSVSTPLIGKEWVGARQGREGERDKRRTGGVAVVITVATAVVVAGVDNEWWW